MRFELVAKEDGHGQVAGSLYGRSVRVIMRSPTHILFTGVGATIWDRKEHSHSLRKVFSERPTKEKFSLAKDRIEATFGEGAIEHVLAAWSKNKTALVDGGGEPMGLPDYIRRERHMARYAAETCTTLVDLTGQIPCCKQCGALLSPRTNHHRMGHAIQDNHPRSLDDCQRMTNHRVIRVHSFDARYPEKWGYVDWFETWDGESLLDDDFCDNKCAALYGRRAAQTMPPLEPGVMPEVKPHVIREDVEHFEKVEQHLTLRDGSKIRI